MLEDSFLLISFQKFYRLLFPISELPKEAKTVAASSDVEWPYLNASLMLLSGTFEERLQYLTKALLSDTEKPGLVCGSTVQDERAWSGQLL